MANTIFHGRDSACSILIGQTIVLFYIILVVPAIILTLKGQICNAQPNAYACNSFNYTKGSEFESNLNAVMKDLAQNTSQTGFNTSVHGQSPNQIYGLVNCRGDATVDQCYSCSQEAPTTIRQSNYCGNALGGVIWMDACFFRYENYSFPGLLYTYGVVGVGRSTVDEPEVFNAALQSLFTNLSAEAESKSNFYASGTTTDSLSRKIYALVQCSRDISSDNCTTCLSYGVNYIFAKYSGRIEVQFFTPSCTVRYDIKRFFNSTAHPPSPSPARAPAITAVADTPRNQKAPSDKFLKKIPITLGVAGGLFLVLLLCFFAIGRRLKSAIIPRLSEDNGNVEEDALIPEDRQIAFTMETLVAATGNFHDDNKLGEGGFGPVYKGTTPDGKEIAVKKLSLKSLQGKKEFVNEVRLVARIQHRNLVNLLGYCAEGSHRLIVYEYLPNKSLDKILFDPNKSNLLDWQKRYNIVRGVARGLLYLHQDSQLRIIHRDIKASNILLDDRLNPKIADFGLSKLLPEDESQVSTRVAGTYGYMAPEYALRGQVRGQVSVKVDVYSFGVLLLELMSGRKNSDFNLPPEMQMLLGWAWTLYKRGDIVQMIDTAIIETCDEEQAMRCINVGLLCTQADSSLRPSMSEVNLMLSSPSVTFPSLTEPAFLRSHVSQTSKSTTSSAPSHTPMVAPPSNADVSITELVPR